jgi:RNA polymerase sigma factor (sigma-70 family)
MGVMEAGAVPRGAAPMVPTLTPRLLRLASDARLVGFVRDGRGGAFEAIYDRHSRGIYAFCRHMLGDADEAEDAVQHTFMAAYSDLLRSDRPMHLRAWLFTIARNRCFTMLRSRREQPSEAIEEAVAEGVAVQVQRRQDLRDLVNDMRRLPDEQRAALVLAEIDALSHAEIAEVLDIPREKVKALVFQARESLVASRNARDTACSEIREQLAFGRGASLRRGNLRRHLRECDGCRAFRAQVERQRKQFALLLPVGPTLAVKEALFGAGAAGGGAAAIGTGVLASGALKSGVAKGLVGAVVTAIGAAGTVVMTTTSQLHLHSLLEDLTGGLASTAGRGAAVPRAGGSGHATRGGARAGISSATGPGARLGASGNGVAASGMGLGTWGAGLKPVHTGPPAGSHSWGVARRPNLDGGRAPANVRRILHTSSSPAPAPAAGVTASYPVISIHGIRQPGSALGSQAGQGPAGPSPGHARGRGQGASSGSGTPGGSGTAPGQPHAAGDPGGGGAPGNSGGAPGNSGGAPGNSGRAPGHGPSDAGNGPSGNGPSGSQGGRGNASGSSAQAGGSAGGPGNSGNAPGHNAQGGTNGSGPSGGGPSGGGGAGGSGNGGAGQGQGGGAGNVGGHGRGA